MKAKTALLIVLCLMCSVVFSACGCSHQWQAATCTEPKTCVLCEKTEGEALGHTEGKWQIDKEATIFEAGKKIKPCTVCGMALSTERYELISYYEDGKFVFSPAEFAEKYAELIAKYQSSVSAEERVMNDWDVTVITLTNGQEITVTFASENEAVFSKDKDIRNIDELAIMFDAQIAIDDSAGVAEAIILYFMALDPSLAVDDASSMCTNLFNGMTYNSTAESSLDKNGIHHTLLAYDGYLVIQTSLTEETE